MKINLQGKNIELTPAITEYATKRVTNLEKLLGSMEEDGGEVLVAFEVGNITNHHKGGSVFHADCLIKTEGQEFYASADKEDLYEAIDAVREALFKEISRYKGRRHTLLVRGARSIKKMLKGLSSRNPFTSKY